MKAVRVFLSAKFSRRQEMLQVASWLRSLDYVVTSRWLQAEEDDLDDARSTEWALKNLEDVLGSDVLIAFAEKEGAPGAARGGRHAELGAALATGKEVILVGKPEHVFHKHPRAVVVQCKTDMARALRAYAEAA